jgi:lipopolysaccharide biosynthesis glycosyltransferase
MMNVLFAANDTVYEGLELAIYTLLSHNKDVNVYIFTMDCEIINEETHCVAQYHKLLDWQIDKLRKIVRYLGNGHSYIKIIDVHDLYMEHLDHSVNRYTGFTPFTALRLLADIALPLVDYTWYFDSDIVITGDIKYYYDMYINKDCYYGAYVTPEACNGKGEMVAGVMFMNLEKMRRDNFLFTARRNYNHTLYQFPDQMAIRDTADPEIFPPTLGYCEDFFDCVETPLIVHFTNQIGGPKIYSAKNREYFFRKWPFLKYAQEGIALVDTIHSL